MNINHLLIVGLISIILISMIEFSEAQRRYQPSDEDILKIANIATQEYLEMKLFPNENVPEESIKIRFGSVTGLYYSPFPYHVRILYDSIIDDKVIHKDVVFLAEFSLGPSNSTAELKKIAEMEYLPPKRIKSYLVDSGFDPFINFQFQALMCKQEFEKVKKASTGEYLCVKKESLKKLIERNFIDLRFNSSALSHWSFESSRVNYLIDGGTIQNMTSNGRYFMTIDIDSKEKGDLLIGLPRSVMDSQFGKCNHHPVADDNFLVRVDGIRVEYYEKSTYDHMRYLVIEFDKNSTKIEIIGSCIL